MAGRAPLRPPARHVIYFEQAGTEEIEHLGQRVVGRVTRLVDEMLGQHRVRPLRVAVRVAIRRIDVDADEVVAELLAQAGESFWWDEGVAGEAKAEHGQILRRGLLLDLGEIVVGQPEITLAFRADTEGQRRLRQHRCEHRGIGHHRQREPTGEAHPDDADTGPTTLLVQ